MQNGIFDGLFVLEMANNHLGNVERGKRIISQYSKIVLDNNIKAAIKLQFRDVDNFIHPDYIHNNDIRYIKKTRNTKLSINEYKELVDCIKAAGLIPMATPFDEHSVNLCQTFAMPIIKIASSCINDWPLIEAIGYTKKPVIVSCGGASLQDIDRIVSYFEKKDIPLALNHCVSIYPSEDNELELNQIDFLKTRFKDHVIGFSTHEYHDWTASMFIAYAKGARTFERHIDIVDGGVEVSAYCSLPPQIDTWFKAYNKAVEMCGADGAKHRLLPEKEIRYLDNLVRGIYAKRDLPSGHQLNANDYYAAIPLLAGQISCREINENPVLRTSVKKDQAIMLQNIDNVGDCSLHEMIYDRGLKTCSK